MYKVGAWMHSRMLSVCHDLGAAFDAYRSDPEKMARDPHPFFRIPDIDGGYNIAVNFP